MTPGESLAAGTLLDERYRIEDPLGSGGMGAVYRATHVALGRPVAVKVLRGDVSADSEWAQRFRREAFATARLDHPNCVGVIDCGALPDGRPYLVMQLVRGKTLFEELDEHERVAVPRALRVMRHVLTGLRHAHDAGLVHRDVKPGNIMLSPKHGAPHFAKLLDFGVVKLLGDTLAQAGGQDLTHAGCAVGSPTYMSPEQITGATIDGRSDLYSATVVLFEMIAGRPPFFSDDAFANIRMHLHTPPPRVAEVALDVALPRGVEELLRDGLAKNVDDRIPNAQAYIDRIDLIEADDRGATATTPTTRFAGRVPPLPAPRAASYPPSPPPRPLRRRLAAIAGGIGAVALLAIVAATNGEGAPDAPDVDAPVESAALADPATPPTASRAAADDVPGLEEVHDLIRGGRRDTAIRRLHGLRRAHPDRAYLALLQGTLYLDKFHCRDGFKAYRAAFAVDPATRADPAVIRSSINALESRSNHRRAADFIVREIGEPAIPFLEAATQSKRKKLRERSTQVLRRLNRASDG